MILVRYVVGPNGDLMESVTPTLPGYFVCSAVLLIIAKTYFLFLSPTKLGVVQVSSLIFFLLFVALYRYKTQKVKLQKTKNGKKYKAQMAKIQKNKSAKEKAFTEAQKKFYKEDLSRILSM